MDSKVIDLGASGVPSIDATLDLSGQRFRVLAVHPPPPVGPVYAQARDRLLGALAGEAADHASLPLMVVGDLNVTRFSPAFRRLLGSGLEDSAEGFGYQPTWPVFLPPLGIPIDHVLSRGGVFIAGRRTGPGVGSDHRALIVDFGVQGGN